MQHVMILPGFALRDLSCPWTSLSWSPTISLHVYVSEARACRVDALPSNTCRNPVNASTSHVFFYRKGFELERTSLYQHIQYLQKCIRRVTSINFVSLGLLVMFLLYRDWIPVCWLVSWLFGLLSYSVGLLKANC